MYILFKLNQNTVIFKLLALFLTLMSKSILRIAEESGK